MNAITVEKLNKVYHLYRRNKDRLFDALGIKKVKYEELHALRDVSFSVARGETVGIIGTNGSGKSTLLKIITGVVSPTSGSVTVDGRISALLELGAGFNMEYTGIENVYLNGSMMGFSKEEIDRRLPEILAFADIGEYVSQPVRTYSTGMFVRLAFAVAINIDPEILIVDEALSVGDAFFQAKCYKKFEDFKAQGKTIVFVSHDLGSIAKYCDRVIVLNKGVMEAEGEPREMVDLYKKLLVSYGQLTDHTTEFTGMARNPDTIEYGELKAEITDIAVFDENGVLSDTIEKDTEFTIRMKVHFHEAVEAPIFAYSFKNLKGTEITGTNTLFEKTELPETPAGQDVTVTFRQIMTLQGGEYLLSFGCTGYYGGEFHVFHRLYDAVHITVAAVKNTVGYYDMHSAAEVTVSGTGERRDGEH